MIVPVNFFYKAFNIPFRYNNNNDANTVTIG